MKIIIASDGLASEIYADPFEKSLKELGHSVIQFTWRSYFKNYQYANRFGVEKNILKSIYYRAQNKILIGPVVWGLNKDFFEFCTEKTPDLIFIYRGTHILPSTLKKIKKKIPVKIFGYNNDDPFSMQYKKYLWRHYISSIKHYDHIFAYRHHNMTDYSKIGYKNTSLLRSYFIKERNFPTSVASQNKYSADVVFVGHFEDDGRDEALIELKKRGVDVKLFGTGWHHSRHFSELKEHFGNIYPVHEDYNLALNSAKICLVFLSKLNNDTYTRRNFEIPAAGKLMLSEYTEDLASLFTEGVEADYFRNINELIKKTQYYLVNEKAREKVAQAGLCKVHLAGHEVTNRAQQIVETYFKS